jgi:formylglycine-generating enzyme required for sulfatase activity
MIAIPAGWFWMGSEHRYPWESPRHRVWLDTFQIAETAVTRREYSRFLCDTGHAEPSGWQDPSFSHDEMPVVGVTWFAALAYCEWFSRLCREAYRLPTEAEWEKACRGGIDDREYAWGDQPPETFDYFRGAWTGPRPVGEWVTNGYGLFNMGDNVHEWCSDWYSGDYYASSALCNPVGPEAGTRRVSRGGSWRHQIKACRAAHRSSLPPNYAYTDYGFRLCRDLPKE